MTRKISNNYRKFYIVSDLNMKVKHLVDVKSDGKPSVFATVIGVSTTTMIDIYRGKTNVGGKVVLAIAKAFPDVDLNWLLKDNIEKSTEGQEPQALYLKSPNDYILENLKYLRTSNEMSQAAFAAKLNTTAAAVSAWESGEALDHKMLLHICSVFEIDVSDMLQRNIQIEGYSPNQEDNNVMRDKLIALLEEKIERYEEDMKEHAPDLARKWKLE